MAVTIANPFRAEIETKMLIKAESVKPRVWKRYADDLFQTYGMSVNNIPSHYKVYSRNLIIGKSHFQTRQPVHKGYPCTRCYETLYQKHTPYIQLPLSPTFVFQPCQQPRTLCASILFRYAFSLTWCGHTGLLEDAIFWSSCVKGDISKEFDSDVKYSSTILILHFSMYLCQ